MRLIPEPPMFPKHLICINETPLHRSLAMFLFMMGENEVSNACKQLTPAKYEKANSMLGLFENKHGLFHSQSFLKGIQSKIIKVNKGYLFAPRKIP